MRFQLPREEPVQLDAFGEACCGVAEVELPSPVGRPMAGYSTDSRVARGTSLPLRARALWIEDDAGEVFVVLAVDLMTGTRYLWEATAALLAPRVGLCRERLLIAGTHTHTGPAGIFGQSLYDTIAGARPGFSRRLADALARALAAAVQAARRAARPARLGVAEGRLWGVLRQASPSAFTRNSEARIWTEPGMPGHGAPDSLTLDRIQIDPRLRVLAWTDPDGALLAVLAIGRGHNTALGHEWNRYDGDWYARACDLASRSLGVPVALLAGSGADANVCADSLPQGEALADAVGARAAPAIVLAAREAAADARPFDLRVRFSEVAPGDLDGFADKPCFGLPALGGAMDSRSGLFRLGLAHPGQVSAHFPPEHPQHPKLQALGPLQDLLRGLVSPPPLLPFQLVQLGGHCLATVPFEPTATTGWRIEQALQQALDAPSCTVVGYSNAYAGYLVSDHEYRVQEYEGASTLWGRHQARAVRQWLVDMAALESPVPHNGTARFETIKSWWG